MSYTVDDDEVAIILRPVEQDSKGEWTGQLSTGLVVGNSKHFKIEVLSYLVHLATLMGTFLEMTQEDEDLYNEVEERRNDNLAIDKKEQKVYEEVEGTDGKVLRLTKYTKTFGNA
tara:strand:- start:139 stop:483 length:345 start_codon:yes stop_codon:yes gene_type:complete